MTDPTPTQRRDWFSSQYETWTPTDGHEPAYMAITFGQYKAACRCSCIQDDPGLLIHDTWFDALDDARIILAGSIHGPLAGQETTP